MKDWLNMVGTICSIASAVIAIWHACKAKKYREEIYKRAKVIFQNMVLEHLKTIQKTIRDIEDARLDNKVLRGKDTIGIINRNFDEIFTKIYNETRNSPLVQRLQDTQNIFKKYVSVKDAKLLDDCSQAINSIIIDINNNVFEGDEK